jgi:nitrogen fixation NifU-like protein
MDLRELYQDLIVDHSRSPRNFREPPGANRQALGHNPLCGDRVTVYLKMDGDRVSDVGFAGAGCAISTASASLMTESVKGKNKEEVLALFRRMHAMLTGKEAAPDPEALGKLSAFSGVRDFPVRVKCATLAWHTLCAALEQTGEVTTE